MAVNQKLVDGLVAEIAKAEQATLKAFREGRIEQEPSFTDRLLGQMEIVFNGSTVGGVRWTAKTLTDRGRGSQEKEYGADFMAVLDVSLVEFNVAKGFLGQAKVIEPGARITKTDFKRMSEQCRKMLSLSASSYVFIYSRSTCIQVVEAQRVVNSANRNPHELSPLSFSQFYEKHFGCFIGDHSIKAASATTLRELRSSYNSRNLFLLSDHVLN
jgi:hypothetical protein